MAYHSLCAGSCLLPEVVFQQGISVALQIQKNNGINIGQAVLHATRYVECHSGCGNLAKVSNRLRRRRDFELVRCKNGCFSLEETSRIVRLHSVLQNGTSYYLIKNSLVCPPHWTICDVLPCKPLTNFPIVLCSVLLIFCTEVSSFPGRVIVLLRLTKSQQSHPCTSYSM